MMVDAIGGRALSHEAAKRPDLRRLAREGTVHFVGIAGAGMSALAEALVRTGGRVSGCDTHAADAVEIGDALRARGVSIEQGHDASHVDNAVAVVVTSAVPADHPELMAARARGLPVFKRAEALGSFVERGRVLAVAGTHGKTTTSAMLAAILAEAGLDPTAFVGGRVPGWGGGLRAGSENLFVVEADEYDRSFLTLKPRVALVTTVEADHLDIYGNVEAVEHAFETFVDAVPADGLVIACVDDEGARRVLASHDGRTLGYGLGADAQLRGVPLESRGRTTRLAIWERGRELGRLTLTVPGMHNVRNALGAFVAAREVGADLAEAQRALAEFRGVGRRFQEIGRPRGVTVVDDYAHHPTEVRATIEAARSTFPGHRVVAVFQPHLYSRTRDFAGAFGAALAAADAVWVTDIYPAREAPIPGITGEMVAQAAESAGARHVEYEADRGALAGRLAIVVRSGDVCVFMGAGDIDRAARALVEMLGRGEAP